MKTKTRKLLLYIHLAAPALLILAGGIAMAVSSSGVVTTTSPIVIPPDPQSSSTIEQRVAARKANVRISQNAERSHQISAKCSLAQSAIGQLRTKDTKVRVQRNQAYTVLATRLNNVVINLGNQGINASELHAKQKLFNEAINKYLATAMSYKTAVDDLVNMDCKADTLGFEATLVQVRGLRAQLAVDGASVKDQIDPLVDSLVNIKKSLNDKRSS